MVSERFQRGLKPSEVSERLAEGFETVGICWEPKEFEEVFGQKHPNKKLLGKSLKKETLKKHFGRTA